MGGIGRDMSRDRSNAITTSIEDYTEEREYNAYFNKLREIFDELIKNKNSPTIHTPSVILINCKYRKGFPELTISLVPSSEKPKYTFSIYERTEDILLDVDYNKSNRNIDYKIYKHEYVDGKKEQFEIHPEKNENGEVNDIYGRFHRLKQLIGSQVILDTCKLTDNVIASSKLDENIVVSNENYFKGGMSSKRRKTKRNRNHKYKYSRSTKHKYSRKSRK
jgi:hypothetical protein